jgi:putative flippase GtrA
MAEATPMAASTGNGIWRWLGRPAQAPGWFLGFVLHVVTGFAAVAAHYCLMWLLLHYGMSALPASAIGFLAGATTRFIFSYVKIFSPSKAIPVTLVRFVAALGLQLLANMLLLDVFLSVGLSVWVAQVATTILLTVANYLVYRLWVFR